MIKAPPLPEPPKHFPVIWLAWLLKVFKIIWEHFPYPADNSIEMQEKPDGLATRAITTATSAVTAETRLPLKVIPDDTIVAGEVTENAVIVLPGKIGLHIMDDNADSEANGSTGHPWFRKTWTGDSATVYIHQARTFVDGNRWKITLSEILIGTMPADDTDGSNAYFPLAVIMKNEASNRTKKVLQQNEGNKSLKILGTDTTGAVSIYEPQ